MSNDGRIERRSEVNMWKVVELTQRSFDSLDPFQKRLELKRSDEVASRRADTVLLVLYGIDERMSERFGVSGIYVLELPEFITPIDCLVNVFDRNAYTKSIIALHFSQLIYRFSVAKRLPMASGANKQLRINSWGREIAREIAREEALLTYRIMGHVGDVLERYREPLLETVELLKTPLSPKTANRLIVLHESVPIAFVQ